MTQVPLRIGLAGLGTVGVGVVRLLRAHADLIATRAGRPISLVAVAARERRRERGIDVSDLRWHDDALAIAHDPAVDVVVELIGGAEGIARRLVEASLQASRPVVTANKALIATHGGELARLAEAQGVPLLFEAAVMGGTPAVKMLREGLVGDEVVGVQGILNGTCNFILSEMERRGAVFGEVLAEAQALGFAEADPTTDVGGFDAGHKIAILAALAFGGAPNFAGVEVEGIERIEPLDIRLAHDLGYRIKLIASALREDGGASVRVHPALVPLDHPLAQAGGALNALFIEGRSIGRLFMQGAGAGAGPTAAAVAADIADVVAGAVRPVFQDAADRLRPLASVDAAHRSERAFVRLTVRDRPGAIAAVSEALAKAEVSIDSFLQRPVDHSGLAPIVLTTQPATEAALVDATRHIAALDAVVERPRTIRIARI